MIQSNFTAELPLSEYKKLCDLVTCHRDLGNRIWDELLTLAPPENILHLILFAHHSFTRGHCSVGRQRVLDFVAAKANKFAQAGYHQQLVDLFFESEEYSGMMQICDILYQFDKFTLFLSQPDAAKKPHYQVALLTYLQHQHPDDKLKKEEVCLQFGKHAELAHMYEGRADKMASDRGSKEEMLGECVKMYKKAARFYKLDQAFDKQMECVVNARLVGLHLMFKKKGLGSLINLTTEDVRSFLFRHPIFYESLIVAQKYGVTDMVPYVFRNAVIEDNMDYFEDYRSVFCIDTAFFEEICGKAQCSRLDETATRNLIVMLSRCNNVALRRSIAQKLSLPTSYL
eukprot:sb/3466404/